MNSCNPWWLLQVWLHNHSLRLHSSSDLTPSFKSPWLHRRLDVHHRKFHNPSQNRKCVIAALSQSLSTRPTRFVGQVHTKPCLDAALFKACLPSIECPSCSETSVCWFRKSLLQIWYFPLLWFLQHTAYAPWKYPWHWMQFLVPWPP